ncbi:hypothetical protein ACFV4K_31595 [Nocardia sp. NPDC059764]|uniref:hypothetical protein n=1 Tax=Nocardia sp. NPDC059764 TaxID=3346939 RepID=UPI0036484B4A
MNHTQWCPQENGETQAAVIPVTVTASSSRFARLIDVQIYAIVEQSVVGIIDRQCVYVPHDRGRREQQADDQHPVGHFGLGALATKLFSPHNH